jgi:hypothetical protein
MFIEHPASLQTVTAALVSAMHLVLSSTIAPLLGLMNPNFLMVSHYPC